LQVPAAQGFTEAQGLQGEQSGPQGLQPIEASGLQGAHMEAQGAVFGTQPMLVPAVAEAALGLPDMPSA
jgi:hypothetical protein